MSFWRENSNVVEISPKKKFFKNNFTFKDGGKAGGTQKYNSLMKNSGKPPKGMYVNHDDLVALATGPTTQGEQLLKAMDREIVSYKRTVSWFLCYFQCCQLTV